VRHYFLNGGEQAVICRVVDQISTTTATLDYNGDGGLVLAAADPGAWANNLSVTVDVGTPGTVLATDEVDPVVEAADGYEPAVSTRESHPNVSIDPNSSRYVVTRLAQHSALARIQAATAMPNTSRDAGLLPAAAPVVTFRDGSDGLADDVVPADVEGPIDRLGDADIVNLVCVPPLDRNTETATETWAYALRWAEAHRAIPLVEAGRGGAARRIRGVPERECRVLLSEGDGDRPATLERGALLRAVRAVAGRIAHTDRTRGVWKAPAGTDTALSGVSGLEFALTDHDSGLLNPSGINALRVLPARGPTI
jgi:hypothetical protein